MKLAKFSLPFSDNQKIMQQSVWLFGKIRKWLEWNEVVEVYVKVQTRERYEENICRIGKFRVRKIRSE